MTYEKALRELSEPYSCVCFYHRSKGWSLDLHSHPFYQFLLVTNGVLKIFYENTYWTCEKGHLSIIPPGYAHSLSSDEGYSQVGFDLQPSKDHRGIIQILENNIKKPVILEKPYLLDVILELNLLLGNLTQLSKLKTTALLDGIVLTVIDDVYPNKNKDFEEKLLNILQKDFSSKINLDMISKELSISKTQLERMTINKFGYGVMEFYNQLRISKACMYLSDHNISIKEISDMLGFCDQAHFNRFFKSKTKYTPVQYRKQKHYL